MMMRFEAIAFGVLIASVLLIAVDLLEKFIGGGDDGTDC